LGLVFFPFSHIHAYLDPGSGSYAIQIIIGVIFGAGFTIKAFGRNIINYLRLKFSNRKRGR
jgi:uncharacterized membrane protein YciS (DUF1049 family)